MKYTNWRVPSQAPVIPPALVAAGCSPLLAAVLQLRGLTEAAEARAFLNAGRELLHDPMLLADMIPAVQRISRAIALGEHVAIYGDYDVDGITAGCLLSDYLRRKGLVCELYIPDRLGEGYGLNLEAIDRLAAQGVTLIITVDCGVTNLEETAYAASLGVDMIVTDHHECREELPDAEAVIDPKRPDCLYPGDGLAGVGVAFKLVCALEGDTQRVLDDYCDLLAMGTVADVMPLTGENRFLVRYGLQMISDKRCHPGITALMEETGVAEKRLTAATIGYSLAPRINAAGRLGDPQTAVELLQTADKRRAGYLAAELCQKNRDRQELEQAIWDQSVQMLADHVPGTPVVLASEGWHPGVIGIVASRLTDAYSVPAVMICLDGDTGKGSCRSIGGFNLYEALASCGELLEGFGGHAMAAGLTVRRENIEQLRRLLTEYYVTHPTVYVHALEPDLLVSDPALLSMECVESLDELEPCGNANPRPLLYMDNALLAQVTPIGGGKHLRLRVEQFEQSYDCVFFGQTEKNLGARRGQRVDIAFAPQINEFRGHRSVQLVITDLRPHEE